MGNVDIEAALEKIAVFLEGWYPSEIASLVVKKQIQMTGAIREQMTEKDLKLLLTRIEKVILPRFMPMEDAKKEIRKLKKEINLRF